MPQTLMFLQSVEVVLVVQLSKVPLAVAVADEYLRKQTQRFRDPLEFKSVEVALPLRQLVPLQEETVEQLQSHLHPGQQLLL